MFGLPSPDSLLREARDFIFSSRLARNSLADSGLPRWPVALHDLIEAIHQLVQSCHMPEFTDHGLPHLCSLVDRLSLWNSLSTIDGAFTCLPLTIDPRRAQ